MDISRTFCCIILVCLFLLIDISFQSSTQDSVPARLYYSSDSLKALNVFSNQPSHFLFPNNVCKKKRKRGKKGGVRARIRRRPFKPFLPTVMMGNFRSIKNKFDEFSSAARFLHEYREASLISLTETWLNSDINDSSFDLPGFSLFRCDRTIDSCKSTGGGVCIYVNDRYCHQNNVNVINKISCPDFELLTIKIVPFYLPREFPSVYINTCYIPPDSNFCTASERITEFTNDQQSKSPDSCIIINVGLFWEFSIEL